MLKPAVFLMGSVPAVYTILQIWLLQAGSPHQLGADPAKELVLIQGEWAIRFLILTLLVTPVRKLTTWVQVSGLRRMLGLFTFFYASLHLLAYSLLLLELDFSALGGEVVKRPYITIGFLAWLMLIPLVGTSTQLMMRRLGKSWRKLHSLVYGIALLAVFHVFWIAKSSYLNATIYGVMLLSLLIYRLFVRKNRLFQPGIKAPA